MASTTAYLRRKTPFGRGLAARALRIAVTLCCFLCISVAGFGSAARSTGGDSASGSALAKHTDAYFAQITSGVVRLTAGNKYGTGVCLDTPCTHVLTNYHVVAYLGSRLKVEGAAVDKITAATGPSDHGARNMESLQKTFALRFDPARDLAVLTLGKPLPKPFHGLSFATYQPKQDQRVTGIAYDPPHASASLAGAAWFSVLRGRLRISEGEIRGLNTQVSSAADNLSATIDGGLRLTFPSNAGNSGGAVVDAEGKVIGIICGAELMPGDSRNVAVGTLALPVSSVFRYLRATEPELWAQLFFGRKMVSDASANELQEQMEGKQRAVAAVVPGPIATLNLDVTPALSAYTDSASMVKALQKRVGEDLALMRNVFAEQQTEMWGDNQHRDLWHHEVAIHEGRQIFREIKKDGSRGKAVGELPYPRQGVRPGAEWSTLLQNIATAVVPLTYLGTSKYQGKVVHVYSYEASAQDKVCGFSEEASGIMSSASWAGYVDCAGAIVTDKQFNPVTILQELYPPFERLTRLVAVSVTYDSVVIPGSGMSLLLPIDLQLTCQLNNGTLNFASAAWSQYHVFRVESAVKLEGPVLPAK